MPSPACPSSASMLLPLPRLPLLHGRAWPALLDAMQRLIDGIGIMASMPSMICNAFPKGRQPPHIERENKKSASKFCIRPHYGGIGAITCPFGDRPRENDTNFRSFFETGGPR
jgi:hypothetical protein